MKTTTHKKTPSPQPASREEDTQVLLEAGKALRDLSHFAKNILQMVSGAAEVADLSLQRKDMPRLVQSCSLLTGNIDRLKRLTIDLCEYSKIRPLSLTPCNLNDLIQKAVKTLPPGMEPLVSSLRLQLTDGLPEADLDAEQITRMIRHLLTHLLDALPDPAQKVRVETCWLPANKELQICVSAPLSLPEPPQALFEPAEYKNSRFRTGLNLPLALRLAAAHYGRIELEPLDNGTVNFLVCLPLP